MGELDLDDIARRQLADYDAHRPGSFFRDAPFELTVPQAYEVQRNVAALRVARGEQIAGYKIGCVSDAVQRQLGIDRPVFGHVFSSELHRSGVTLDYALFENLAIEGEFAIRITEDVIDPERAVGEVLAVIELHNDVFRGARGRAAELIANNALHAGVVVPLGEGGRDLEDGISVFQNGEQLGTQTAGAIPGGLIASVLSVSRQFALRRGDLILTGSPLPLYPVRTGDSLSVRSGRCGEVSLNVR